MRAMISRKARSRRWFLTGGAAGPGPDPVARIAEGCLARAGVVCQACGDTCPERAIRFQLRRGGPSLPRIVEDCCTACGECVPVCPVGAITLPEERA